MLGDLGPERVDTLSGGVDAQSVWPLPLSHGRMRLQRRMDLLAVLEGMGDQVVRVGCFDPPPGSSRPAGTDQAQPGPADVALPGVGKTQTFGGGRDIASVTCPYLGRVGLRASSGHDDGWPDLIFNLDQFEGRRLRWVYPPPQHRQ